MPESAVEGVTLFDVPALTQEETGEIADALMAHLAMKGWEDLQLDQKIELRLLRTLLDGFADA